MIFESSVLLLLMNLASVNLYQNPGSDCDYSERVAIGQNITFTNPQWPGTYSPGTSCRWIFDCHVGYVCRLRCRDVGLPKTKSCYMDKLLVSPTGHTMLKDARVFCGQKRINTKSIGSRISIALVASKSSPGGRFRCTVKTEIWAHPSFNAMCGPYCVN